MLGSYRLILLVIKLILFQLFGLIYSEHVSHRLYSNQNSSIMFVSVSIDDYFAVINCTTPERVPFHKLDWYFQKYASIKPPRVIWQRGRSNIQRYIAYSPDQFRHFLQIKPIQLNDSGIYMCLDQTTGFHSRVELIVHDTHNSGNYFTNLSIMSFICLILFSTFLSRHTASESQIT